MQPIKTTISGVALCGVSLAAALVLASAPAASPPTATRPLLTGSAARSLAPARTETATTLLQHFAGRRSSSAATTRLTGIEASAPDAVGGRVRVVIESRDRSSARAAVLAVGGRVERTAGGLVQALVSPSALAVLEARP